MTVLWIDLVSELGGAQHSMAEVCESLSAAGAEVVAAVPYGPLFDRLSNAGLKVYPVSPVRARKRGWGFFTTTAKLLRAPSTVSQIIRGVKPDIIHANSLPAFLAASHAGTQTPVIWHVRDLRLPTLVAREAAKKAVRVIAASEAIDENLVEILSPRTLGRIRIIRNGIQPDRFRSSNKAAARKQFGLPQDVPVIGMIAHLVPWKRHDAFIQAAEIIRRQRPEAHFVIVGRDLFHENTRWVNQLEDQARQAGLDACLHWIKTTDEAEEILPALDLFVHPALNEPFGRVLCEAMAAQVPVIAVASGGPANIIENRVSGILVRTGEPQELASEVLALLADAGLAARLAQGGLARVQSRFTTRQVCDQLAKEYRAVLAEETAANSSSSDDE